VLAPARLLPVLVAALVAAPAAAAQKVAVAPAPAWVEPVALPVAPAPSAEDAGGHVAFLLVDDQVRRGPAGLEHYQRMARQVLATSGIDDASELRIDFDPEYQAVTLHEVVIRRGAERRQALRPSEIKIIQREAELDRRIYDGRLTAVVFLHDVRVGDVIDATWTIRGQNPVYAGRSALGFDLGWGVPVSHLSVRVLWPEDRPLAVRVHGEAPAPGRTVRRGEVEYRLERRPATAVAEESDLPNGVDPFPWVEFSEWSSWDEVVRWALPLYTPGRTSPAMEAKLAEWRAISDEARRVRAALRFVQDEVRYLGMELGAGSHRPTQPGEVLQRRFGDCKDKSLLLVALLRALGVEAAPALVSTTQHAAIERRLPSPKAFDHVVVRARVAGAERWLEPTRSLERGPLDTLVPPGYRRALVLAQGERALAELPEPSPSLVVVTSTWKVARWTDPVAFEVVTRYEGLQAVGMRHELADTPAARLQKRYLEHYAREEPGVEVAAPIQVEDAPDEDRLTITEHYRLPAAKEGVRRDFVAEAIQERLVLPKTARRTLPLRVAHPALVRERLQLELPGAPAITPDDKVVDAGAMRLTRRGRIVGKQYVVDLEYQTLRTSVDASAVAGHLAKVRDMQDLVSFSLPMAVVKPGPARAPAATKPSGGGYGWVIYLVAVAGFLLVKGAVVGVRRLRRGAQARGGDARSQAFFQGLVERPGASARTPIAVRSAPDLLAHAHGLRCRCGSPVVPDPATAEGLMLDGRPLQVARAPCGRCGEVTRVYFVVG
jgi:uncharacterized protein DUF3857/transglutaminase superfamily protein